MVIFFFILFLSLMVLICLMIMMMKIHSFEKRKKETFLSSIHSSLEYKMMEFLLETPGETHGISRVQKKNKFRIL